MHPGLAFRLFFVLGVDVVGKDETPVCICLCGTDNIKIASGRGVVGKGEDWILDGIVEE